LLLLFGSNKKVLSTAVSSWLFCACLVNVSLIDVSSQCVCMNVCIRQVEIETASEPLVQKAYWHGGSAEGER